MVRWLMERYARAHSSRVRAGHADSPATGWQGHTWMSTTRQQAPDTPSGGGGDGSAVHLQHSAGQLQSTVYAPTQISQTTIPIWPDALVAPLTRGRRLEARLRAVRLRALLGRVLLFVLDAALVTLAFDAAYYIRFVLLRGVRFTTAFIPQPLGTFQRLQIVVTVGMLAFFMLKGLYWLRPTGTWFKQLWIIVSATTIAFAVYSAYAYLFHSTDLFVSQQRALVALTW